MGPALFLALVMILAPESVRAADSTVELCFTGNVLSEIEPCGCASKLGGVTRWVPLVREARRARPAMLVLDSGDLFFRDRFLPAYEEGQQKLKAEILADALRDMQVDCLLPGEADLACGFAAYRNLVARSGGAAVASNLKAGGRYPFDRIRIVEAGGFRIGVIGLLAPGLPLPDLDGQTPQIEDPIASARGMVQGPGKGLDFLVALTHQGRAADEDLGRRVPGLDVILGAHSRELYQARDLRTPAPAFQAGFKSKHVGFVSLGPGPAGAARKLIPVGARIAPVMVSLPEDPAYVKKVTDYRAAIAGLAAATPPAAVATVPETEVYWGVTLCAQCHVPQMEFWKTTSHARAYQTLVDKKQHMDVECLPCHTTGYATLMANRGGREVLDVTGMESVQCEACHGSGSRHSSAEVRTRARLETTCRGCHTAVMDPKFDLAMKLPKITCPPGRKR